MMKDPSKIFDVAILGTGLSGLIAANRLIRENRSVLILKEEGYRSSYTRGGYHFFPMTTFSEQRIPAGLLRRLSFSGDQREGPKKRTLSKQNGAFQVILPESRIDLYRDPSLLEREWKREFPKELKQIEFFYAELKRIKEILKRIKSKAIPESNFPICESSFFKKWPSFDGLPGGETDRWLSSFSPEFKTFIELQMISYGYLWSDSFSLSLVSHLLLDDDGDTLEARVDLENVEQGMIEKFTRSGGSIQEIQGVEKAEMNRRDEISFQLRGEGKTVRCRTFLLNSPLHHVSSLFGKKGKVLGEWSKKIRPRFALVPFFLGINEKVVPVGMGNLLVSLSDLQKPYENGNLLFLRLSPKGDEHHAPEGKRALTVQGLLPYEDLNKSSISNLRDGMMLHLKHLFPFLENHIEFIDEAWAEDQIHCWSYPHYYFEGKFDFKWRKGIVPAKISKRLFFSGKENFPYLGLEGEILAGLMGGAEILKKGC